MTLVYIVQVWCSEEQEWVWLPPLLLQESEAERRLAAVKGRPRRIVRVPLQRFLETIEDAPPCCNPPEFSQEELARLAFLSYLVACGRVGEGIEQERGTSPLARLARRLQR